MVISIDFETRSTLNLRKTGVYPYAWHPDTDVWCMAFAVDDGPIRCWYPGDPVPDVFKDPDAVTEYRAWNAEFERVIYGGILHRRYGFPRVPLTKWFDTAAQAAALALPRGLGHAAQVLGLPEQKDDDGRRLMLQMAKPRRVEEDGTIVWWDVPEKVDRLVAYCIQDVQVERAIARKLPPLSDLERWVYIMDQRANTRGFAVDHDLVEACQEMVARDQKLAGEALYTLTDGYVASVTDVVGITTWVRDQGVEIPDLRKDTVRDLLAEGGLPPRVVSVLEIRAASGKTSTAKLAAFQNAAGPDGRVRGTFLYHGASTGRWAGRLVQPQNFPRPEVRDPERYIDPILREVETGEDPSVLVASLLRSMIVSGEGKILRAGDYSQIEARVVAWVANSTKLLTLFSEGGKVYEEMAAVIFGKPVEEIAKDSFERQIGKNSVLGCGFGMGAKRFQGQVKEQTGIDIPDTLAERTIEAYRTTNPEIPRFWKNVYDAAYAATLNPGVVMPMQDTGAPILFYVRDKILWCRLPSGRKLAYSLPEIRDAETPWGEIRPTLTFCAVQGPARKWKRTTTYGGHLTENIVQAIARDCMAEAWLRLEIAGYPVIMTVHDELVTEPDIGHGSQQEFETLLATRPKWAPDLPIVVEGWEGHRYRK